jgi:hypothetical protein
MRSIITRKGLGVEFHVLEYTGVAAAGEVAIVLVKAKLQPCTTSIFQLGLMKKIEAAQGTVSYIKQTIK